MMTAVKSNDMKHALSTLVEWAAISDQLKWVMYCGYSVAIMLEVEAVVFCSILNLFEDF
jgi:hypothetical protein